MVLRRAILFLLLANGLSMAKSQCEDLDIIGVITDGAIICAGDSTLLVAQGIFPTTTVLHWQLLVGADWQTFGPANDSVYVDPTGTTSFRCFADCGNVPDTSEAIGITVVNIVLSLTSLAPDTSCGAVNDTLVASGADTYAWIPASSLILASGDTVFSTASGTTTYTVTGIIGACSASDSITLQVVPAPFATHGGDTLFCSGDPDASIEFAFNGDGPWDISIIGPDGPYGETGNTSGTFTINNPGAGAYEVDVLASSSCPNDPLNNGGPFEVMLNQPPSQATIDQAPDTICQNTTGLLVADAPDTGTGSWAQVSGPPVQINPQSGVSVTFTPTVIGSYGFAWSVGNIPCDPTTASTTVIVTAGAPLANAGPAQSVCSGSGIQLQGNAASPGTGVWAIVSSPAGSAAVFSDSSAEHTIFTPDTGGDFVLRWTITSSSCGSTDSSVVVSVVQSGSAPTILGLDDEAACDGEYQTLRIQDPIEGTSYSWACDGWTAQFPDDTLVTVEWAYDGATMDTITVTPSGPCQIAAIIPIQLSTAPASCPRGIVYFEPHGLAILDATANYFQWGTLDADFHFLPDSSRTAQTTFVPGLTSCDLSDMVVRTSITGSECWSTTISCATPEMLNRPCPANDGMVQELQVRAYPNPSNGGNVTLEALGQSADPLSIDLSDMNGRMLSHGTIRMNGLSSMTIDLQRFDRGIYVLRTWNTDIDQTIKLVID